MLNKHPLDNESQYDNNKRISSKLFHSSLFSEQWQIRFIQVVHKFLFAFVYPQHELKLPAFFQRQPIAFAFSSGQVAREISGAICLQVIAIERVPVFGIGDKIQIGCIRRDAQVFSLYIMDISREGIIIVSIQALAIIVISGEKINRLLRRQSKQRKYRDLCSDQVVPIEWQVSGAPPAAIS